MKARQPRQNDRGFTLVELMVTLVVLSIAAAVVVPYAVSSGDLEVVSAARVIASDLQYAQNYAVTHQQSVTVRFDPSEESYSLSNQSGTLEHPIQKSAYVVDFDTQRGFGGLDVVSASFGGSQDVTFDALGSPSDSGAVTVQSGPHVYRIDVASISGRVTVERIDS